LGLVGSDVADAVLLQKRQHLPAVLFAQPAAVPELDRQGELPHELLIAEDLLQAGRFIPEPGRVLKDQQPELAGIAQRSQGGGEGIGNGVPQGRIRNPDAEPVPLCRRDQLPQWLGERTRVDAVAGQGAVGLYMEGELRRGPLGPEFCGLERWNGVVGGIYLHRIEIGGVVAEALVGRCDTLWVELSAGEKRFLRPGAGSDADSGSR